MFAPTDLRGKRHNNNVNRLHKRQSKKQRYRYRKGQTKAFASPRRTARETSDSAGRVEQVFPRAVFPGTTGRCGLLSLDKPAVAISAGRRAGHRPLQIYLFMKDKTTPLPCRASRTERSPLSPTVTFPHPVGNHLYERRQYQASSFRGGGKPQAWRRSLRFSGEQCSPLRYAFSVKQQSVSKCFT